MATQADPELRAEVDFMILDYLACLAIERTLSAAEDSTRGSAQGDEVNWMVEPVQGESYRRTKLETENRAEKTKNRKTNTFTTTSRLSG